MCIKRNQVRILTTLLTVAFFVLPIKAQITMGSQTKPHDFSVLELISSAKRTGGLRLPLLTTTERDSLGLGNLTDSNLIAAAKGLTIYNTTTGCLEFWNTTQWVSLCSDILTPLIDVEVTPPYDTIPVLSSVPLTATVDPSNGTDAHYRWETSENGTTGWTTIDGETASTLNAEAMIVGTTWYRVVAYNSIDSVISKTVPITGTMPSGGLAPNIQLYAGAFWKANETGERLIQFGVGTAQDNNYGDWTAAVVWYDNQWDPNNKTNPDGVVLANSDAFTLPKSGDAESFQVTGSQLIKGTVAVGGTISFRIGLNRPFTSYNESNNPARYAVVLLSYNNGSKIQKMFMRQGEGADYVMRPGDSGTGVPTSPTIRPKAVKFMPYNVTDPSGSTPTNWGNAISLSPATSKFTNFPTKAGYFFMENDTKCFAPDIPVGILGAWTRNRGTTVPGGYWSSTLESCPTGYRRPSDGANDTGAFGVGSVADSEIRQSLWLNPPSGINSNAENSTWGYYADGYFDRNKLVASLYNTVKTSTSTPNSAVNTNSVDVAYEGKLFFNPITNASLFFPAGGFRFDFEGSLYNAGGRARYWTSTSYSLTNQQGNAWFLFLYANTDNTNNMITAMYYDSETSNTDTPPGNNSKTSGALMRCVKQ